MDKTSITFRLKDKSTAQLLQYLSNFYFLLKESVSHKQLEITLLELLEDLGGYFADEFNSDQFKSMRNNVASDFPIFLETWIDKQRIDVNNADRTIGKLAETIQQIELRMQTLETQNSELSRKLKVILEDTIKNDGVVDLSMYYSEEEIIIAKLRAGQNLTNSELQKIESYLITKF